MLWQNATDTLEAYTRIVHTSNTISVVADTPMWMTQMIRVSVGWTDGRAGGWSVGRFAGNEQHKVVSNWITNYLTPPIGEYTHTLAHENQHTTIKHPRLHLLSFSAMRNHPARHLKQLKCIQSLRQRERIIKQYSYNQFHVSSVVSGRMQSGST